jgi:23S rRNA (guanosine2251-2'-O)-methyltransferase
VLAALGNPRRTGFRRLVATAAKAGELHGRLPEGLEVETRDGREIERMLPQGAAHQGLALQVAPLEPVALAELAEPAEGLLLMLDQVTDPQNVGAILRSAAAFGARGVVLQERHAPPLGGAVAKAAVGALDLVPVCRVVNLSRALEQLAEAGWRSVGLDGEAPEPLRAALDERPTVLVLGSEGEGLRRLVAEHCDATAHIPMHGGFESLNVSAAAAIALYEASQFASQGNPVLVAHNL